MPVEIGKVVEGTVTSITSFGAFIQLSEGKTGLCHISEVADGYVKDISSHLQENQKVKVKIIGLDEKGKISLSIRKAMPKSEETKKDTRFRNDRSDNKRDFGNKREFNNSKNRRFKKDDNPRWKKKAEEKEPSFEDKLSQFLKDSDDRQQSMKKSMKSSRRSNGYSSRGM